MSEHDDLCGPMAAAFLNDYSPRLEAVSAGLHPAAAMHPLLVTAMRECLVDLSAAVPAAFSGMDAASFDFIVTVGVAPEALAGFANVVPLEVDGDAGTLEEMRVLCDRVKNESFIIYRSRFHRYSC